MTALVIFTVFCAVSLPLAASQRQNGDLRLVGHGANRLSGRLEVYYNGHWGSVCATERRNAGFDLNEGAVACRQMGLGNLVDVYTVNRFPELRFRYGEGSGQIFLERVQCDGPESHILNCRHYQQLGNVSASCSHANDVSIVCSGMSTPYNGEVRLSPVGSSSIHSQGLVQLHSNNRWAAVCYDSGASGLVADVSCRQLGYTHAVSYRAHNSSSGSPFWGAAVQCAGSEACLAECSNSLPTVLATRNCEAVFVQCGYDISSSVARGSHASCQRPQAPLEGAVRLTMDDAEFSYDYPEGHLEIFRNGAWGLVCHSDYNSLKEEDVVCKQLGFPSARSVFQMMPFLGIGDRVIYDISCSGVESSIGACNVTQYAGQCIVFDILYVSCTTILPPFGSVTLRDGVGSRGTLLVHSGEFFIPVCASTFTATHGEVACRQLGYGSFVEFKSSSYYTPEPTQYSDKSIGRLLVTNGSCSSDENYLISCLSGPVDSSGDCLTSLDEVVLSCSGGGPESDVRLVDGPSPREGRLEVYFVDEWGSVCAGGGDSMFGYLEASVVCRTLGYEGAARDPYSIQRSSDSSTQLDTFVCSGFEESIFDCQLSFGRSNCSLLVGIECTDSLPVADGTLRLSGDRVESDTMGAGRLEISYYGRWMTVCSTYFSSEAAEVACRQLGFTSVVDICRNSSCYGDGEGFIHVAVDMCSGDEDRLLDCNREFYASQLCNHSMDIGLECARDVPPIITTAPPPVSTTFDTLYIILIVVGSCLLLASVLCVLCCVSIICKCRKKKQDEGTWTAPSHRNGGRPPISANNSAFAESEGNHKKSNELTKESPEQYDDSSEGIIERSVTHANGKRPTSPLEITKGGSPLPSPNHYSTTPSRGPSQNHSSHVYQNIVEIHSTVDEAPPNYDELDLFPATTYHVPTSASSTGFSSESSPGATMDSGLGGSTHEHDDKEDLQHSYTLGNGRHETML